MRLVKINIKRYRSINDLTVDFKEHMPLIICGSNNVGKTNFLRALDLFFSLNKDGFNTKKDIPYDIEEGKRGGGYNTRITGWFEDQRTNDKYQITTIYKRQKNEGNILEIKATKNTENLPASEANSEANKIIKEFRFLFVESSNVDIPRIIKEIIDEEVLPLGLDTLRKKQTVPLKKLEAFIKSSKTALEQIEKGIDSYLNDFIISIPGIDNRDWKIKILFTEIDKLRDALSGLIDFTLYDKNNTKMESKGSGIQRIVFLSILKYIADKTKKRIIWGIDEPEAFLQPALQKRVYSILNEIAEKQSIIFTTHSQHFVDVSNLQNTYLFEADYEKKEYVRKQGEEFYRVKTFTRGDLGELEKIQNIKKHLGISRNDNWEIMKYNLLVEGDEDKKYLETLMDKFCFDKPNILVSGGTSKVKGYLQYLSDFCSENKFKPTILCLLDYDNEGKDTYKKLEKAIGDNKYKVFDLKIKHIERYKKLEDTTCDYEIEDFIYPEIIRKAANSFLSKKGYKKIKKNTFNQRESVAFKKNCVLSFLTQITKTNNVDKQEINFEDANGGVKKIICEKACKHINTQDIAEYDSKYPEVKEFIKSICVNGEGESE